MQQLKISSPAFVVEGQSYSVTLTVTNQSIRAGIPTEAMLKIAIEAIVSLDAWVTETLIPVQEREEYFSAGQTRTFDYTMDVPLGLAGYSGYIGASVKDPTGLIILDSASEPLIIEAVVPELANIYGVITFRKTGAQLPDVKVTINTLVTYTDSLGRYAFEKLTPGTYTMTLEKEGYEPLWDTVKIVGGDNEINAEMTLVPAVIASLRGYITDDETKDAIVSAEVTVVEHTDFMEANVYRALSNTNGFYSLENMAFENKPITVDISVKAGGYTMIIQENIGLTEGDNTLNFEMVWIGERDVPRFISYELPDWITAGEEFPVKMTVYLPYQDAVFEAYLGLRLQGTRRIYLNTSWKLLPAHLYDPLRLKRAYIRFDSAGTHTLEATLKAVYRLYVFLLAPLPPGTYDVLTYMARTPAQLTGDYLTLRGLPDYKSPLVKVGTVECISELPPYHVSELHIHPNPCPAGEDVDVFCVVTNIVNYTITASVNFSMEDERGLIIEQTTRSVELEPRKGSGVRVIWRAPDSVGNYTIKVNGLTGILTII